MSTTCAFCGSPGPLTREHIFGQWVSKIGLDLAPAQHHAGALNGLPRSMGTQPPYRQTVKNFCASCNNGWMSTLEVAAQRVLTPLILGRPGTIAVEDQSLIAMWAQKTALTAMLLSSEEQRASGYGLAPAEYEAFYECSKRMEPLAASRAWVGRYEGGTGYSGVRVTPLTIRISGLPEPERPQAYATTIVLGELVLQGVRFTTPELELDLTTELEMPQFWPSDAPVDWPAGELCTRTILLRFADGRMLRSVIGNIELRPWRPATELPQSALVGGKVKVPALCGRHSFFYPQALLAEALSGRFFAFITGCECPVAYLLQTERDGVHCKAAGEAEGISAMYEDLPGEEFQYEDEMGAFICKRMIPSGSSTTSSQSDSGDLPR